MSTQNINFLLSLLGRISRNTPYFPGKWRIVDWCFHHFFRSRRYSEVIPFGNNLRISCNLWDESPNGIWGLGTNQEMKEATYFRTLLRGARGGGGGTRAGGR